MAIINKTGLEGVGDFLGFKFRGIHSSDFRIIRVSKGNRYEESLLPSSKDTTIDIPGRDGLLYMDSKYQQKEWTISFAFDDLYEENIRAMKQWLAPKAMGQLMFDEDIREDGNTYRKYYNAKVKGQPKISYIAFDEKQDDGTMKRVYKGEGSLQFICYEGYGHDPLRFHIQSSAIMTGNQTLSLTNLGDIPTPIYIGPIRSSSDIVFSLTDSKGNEQYLEIDVSQINKPNEDPSPFFIDSQKKLIVQTSKIYWTNDKLTYTIDKDKFGMPIIYNGAIKAGDFLYMPEHSTGGLTFNISYMTDVWMEILYY
jgi:phage-related protein